MNRKLTKFTKVLVMIVFFIVPKVYAASVLVGTPQTELGATVYTAIVEPNQTYSNVFGVQSSNTDYSSYGKVVVNQGTVTGTIYGNRAISGDVYTKSSFNVVDITNSNVGSIYGGYAYGGSDNASVYNNSVTINSGNVTGYVYGASADGATLSVTGNKVNIKDAQIGKTVYGACAYNTESWLSMLRNEVIIENSTVNGSVYGGYASGYATASNSNKVDIRKNTLIKGSVYGGYALSSSSDAKNNIVLIQGGTVNGRIYGGVGRNASNNIIVVKSGDLTNAYLYGYSDGRKAHSGNTLELWAANTKVKASYNFENYFFIISQDVVNKNDQYMLKVDTPVDLSGVNVGVGVKNGTTLKIDDKINLIDKAEGTPTLEDLDGITLEGGSLLTKYDFDLSVSNGTLIAIAKSQGSPMSTGGLREDVVGEAYAETKALLEGQVASIALLGKSNELAMSVDLSSAENSKKWATFVTADYGKTDYYSDSHIKLETADFVAGVTKDIFGIYLESSHSQYSTFDSFETGPVFGSGNLHNYGVGAMVQLDGADNKGFYLKALGSIGYIQNNWSTNDFFKEKVSYKINQLYYGVSATVGYQNKIGNRLCYNLNGQLMLTHQNGSDVNISDEKMQFQGTNSKKTKMGLKLSYNGFLSPFIGISWGKEFDAVSQGKVNNLTIDAANLKGSTGIFDFGLKIQPKDKAKWQLNVAGNYYFGVRQELKGSALFSLNF